MPFHQASPMAVVLLTALTFLTGCLGPAIHGNVKDKVMEPQPIIETKTGRALSPARLAADLDGTRVIFLGEIHDHPLQHQRQLEIIEALWARDRKLVIGLELFEHPSQILLDQWTRGLILKDDFKNELEGIFSPDILAVYFPLLEWAGKRRVPLLALNLPRKISALVARNGLTDLSDEQVRALPREIEVGPDEYRQRVARAFKHHGMFMDLEKFFTAQVVRDEAMAQALADYLLPTENKDIRAVVIAGNEHVAGGYGLPDRVARRLPAARASLLMPDSHDDYPKTPSVADYIWASPPSLKRRSRLGITLRTDDHEQLMVTSVMEGSLAQKIGLKTGDRLVRMNGFDLKSPMDIHRAATAPQKNRENMLRITRDGQSLDFTFAFDTGRE